MVRDELMQQVIHRKKEPITPFIERARQLFETCGISTILVAGSSGAFFHIADTVIQMDSYHPVDITGKVKETLNAFPSPLKSQKKPRLSAFQSFHGPTMSMENVSRTQKSNALTEIPSPLIKHGKSPTM